GAWLRGDEPRCPPGRALRPGRRRVAGPPVLHDRPLPRDTGRAWPCTNGGATARGEESILSLAEVLEGEPLAFAADMHCGTHWSALDQQWQVVSAADLVQLNPPAPDAHSALVLAEYGYATNEQLDDQVNTRS